MLLKLKFIILLCSCLIWLSYTIITDGLTSDGIAGNHDVIQMTGMDCTNYPGGIAWDGNYLWHVSEGSVPPYDNYIFKVDPKTGKVLGKWRGSSYAECGAAFDGKYLWTCGVHNPNGVLPPWDDPQKYELIYKYSLENGTPTLLERYSVPYPPCMGVGNALTFDRNGNLWISNGIGEKRVIIYQVELLPGVEASYHPGLENVWSTRVVKSYDMPLPNWRAKAFEWIYFKDGKDLIFIGGYGYPEIYPQGVFVIDPADDFKIIWSHILEANTAAENPRIGSFGAAWDSENEVLWTLEGSPNGVIFRHGRDSETTYLEALFGPVDLVEISVTPLSYDFGNVEVKKSKTASFKVKNNGKADLLISTSITGTDVSMFTITSGGGVSKTIKPGKTLTIKVSFKPTSAGSKSSTLEITSNDPDTPTIDIPLTATLPATTPDISVVQTTLDFGSTKVGKKVTKTLKITNNGTGDLVITLSGLEETDFSIQGSSGVTIKGKKSYTLKVLFTPKLSGPKAATLKIDSNDPDTPILDIELHGSTIEQPQQFTLTVTKAGTGSGTVTSFPVGINCGSDCSESYDQGTSVTLTATPASGSTFGGWSGDADCSDGVVVMNANKACTATFNPQVVGYTLTVVKSGTGSGTVTSFPVGINCGSDCSESYDQGTSVTLTATPASGSTFGGWLGGGCSGTGTCVVVMNADIAVTAVFSAGPPAISVSPSSLDFGSVKVGKKITKTLKITNNSLANLVITLSGLEGTDFSIQGSSSVTIKSKKSYTLKVLFTPKSAGSKTATLRITSNDSDAPTIDISLSGTGQ